MSSIITDAKQFEEYSNRVKSVITNLLKQDAAAFDRFTANLSNDQKNFLTHMDELEAAALSFGKKSKDFTDSDSDLDKKYSDFLHKWVADVVYDKNSSGSVRETVSAVDLIEAIERINSRVRGVLDILDYQEESDRNIEGGRTGGVSGDLRENVYEIARDIVNLEANIMTVIHDAKNKTMVNISHPMSKIG